MKERVQHPSTLISAETIDEINYRVHLWRLAPPLTPEESAGAVSSFHDNHGKLVIQNDASRRKGSRYMGSMTRDYLRVLVDLGLVKIGE